MQGSTNLNAAELEYLSNKMDPIECKKLLETINLKSSNNDKINNKDHVSIIGMTQIDCRLNLKEWNLQYQGEFFVFFILLLVLFSLNKFYFFIYKEKKMGNHVKLCPKHYEILGDLTS